MSLAPTKRVKRPNWTYPRFLEEARRIHQDNYDYSCIKETDIKGCRSRVTIICKKCRYQWETSLDIHINGSQCPDCQGKAPYTLEKFLRRAHEVHGDKHNYDQVTKSHITNSRSRVPILCNTCGHQWCPKITDYINDRNGCPDCTNHIQYTLSRFLKRAEEIYGEAFEYLNLKEGDITGTRSRIQIRCLTCEYEWESSVGNHLNKGRGCPECNGGGSWDYKRLMRKAQQIHGDDYDYSLVQIEDVQYSTSTIPVRCNECMQIWNPSIHSHITWRSGCPNCSYYAPWTTIRLKIRGERIHRGRYDYSLVQDIHVKDVSSRIPVICTICKYVWWPTINNHIGGRSGCNRCCRSKGELACENALAELMIPFMTEFVIPSLYNRYYDFAFIHNSNWYFIEFDGIQHFQACPWFHMDEQDLKEKQQVDAIKTLHAIHYGYMIRIDYTQIDLVKQHIINALHLLDPLHRVYYSTPEMYHYISAAL